MVLLLILMGIMILIHFKAKITGETNDDGEINDVEIMVSLKYLSHF